MDQDKVFRKKYGSFRRFFRMLWKAPLPILWILVYIGVSFALTHVGVSATEYSAKLYSGDVDTVTVVIPFLLVTLIVKAFLLLLTVFGICPLWLAVLLETAAVAFTYRYSVHLLDYIGKY